MDTRHGTTQRASNNGPYHRYRLHSLDHLGGDGGAVGRPAAGWRIRDLVRPKIRNYEVLRTTYNGTMLQ